MLRFPAVARTRHSKTGRGNPTQAVAEDSLPRSISLPYSEWFLAHPGTGVFSTSFVSLSNACVVITHINVTIMSSFSYYLSNENNRNLSNLLSDRSISRLLRALLARGGRCLCPCLCAGAGPGRAEGRGLRCTSAHTGPQNARRECGSQRLPEPSPGPAEPFEEKLRPQGSCPWPLAAAAQINSVFSLRLLLSSRERLVPDLSGAQVAPPPPGLFLAPL